MKRVTIGDIAARLSISKASVSYALNGRPGVSEETRAKVIALAEELGFEPSSAAVALSASRTRTVGVVLARDPDVISLEAFYLQTITGIEEQLNEIDGGLLLRLVPRGVDQDLQVYRRWVQQGRVDGFILFDECIDDPRPALMDSLGVPAVMVGSRANGGLIGRLLTPESSGTGAVLGHLQDHGHRHIGHVGGPVIFAHEQLRQARLREEGEARGLRVQQAQADYSFEVGLEASAALLRSSDAPTALVMANDLMATAAVRAAEEAGLSVPQDVSIVAWDDSVLCRIARPEITALDNHPRAKGRLAAQMLAEVIGGAERETRMAPPSELRVRGSTGAAPVRAPGKRRR